MPRQAVFFLIDTQGANAVGCYAGNPALGTPNVDRLAREGVRFDRAYTCSPVCGPARSAIFTGLYPHANGVLGNDQSPHLDLPTLGQRVSRAGVKAAYIGKWHLDGTDYFGDGRCPPGWDPPCWFDGRNYLESLPDEAARALSRRVLDPAEVAKHGITAGFTHAHRSADRAIGFIREHQHEDFLLVVSIDEPHHPFICPEPFAGAFEDFRLPLGPGADDPLAEKPRGQQEWARHHAAHRQRFVEYRDGTAFYRNARYFACNSYSDYEVGRVLAQIDACTPGALVTYTADHGDMFFAHGLAGKGPAVYDEVARVPLIVRWPGHAPAGVVAPHPVTHVDLVPTWLELFGIERPPLLQGMSLMPVIRDHRVKPHECVFVEFNRFEVDHDGFGAFAPIRCAFDGHYKLAINLLDRDELYDMAADPAELHNRVWDAETAVMRDRLHAGILEWMNRTRDPLRGPAWQRRPWSTGPEGSTWGGPTRPRPFDLDFLPPTLLYDDGRIVTRASYDKS